MLTLIIISNIIIIIYIIENKLYKYNSNINSLFKRIVIIYGNLISYIFCNIIIINYNIYYIFIIYIGYSKYKILSIKYKDKYNIILILFFHYSSSLVFIITNIFSNYIIKNNIYNLYILYLYRNKFSNYLENLIYYKYIYIYIYIYIYYNILDINIISYIVIYEIIYSILYSYRRWINSIIIITLFPYSWNNLYDIISLLYESNISLIIVFYTIKKVIFILVNPLFIRNILSYKSFILYIYSIYILIDILIGILISNISIYIY